MGIKIQDIAYVRFSAPDLDQMETFLTEFGMVRADRTGDTLYMRGLDGDAFLHVTHGASRDFSPPVSKPHRCKTSKRSLKRRKPRSIVWMVPVVDRWSG